MTVFTTQWACRNRAISDTSAETNGRAAGATSAGFMSGILSTQVSLFPPGASGCRFHNHASGAAICASARAALGVAWGARRKPGLASPANMSKRGLSARHSVPNQTLSLVNFRLPKGNPAAGNQGRPGGYGGLGFGFHAPGGGSGWSPRLRDGGSAAASVRSSFRDAPLSTGPESISPPALPPNGFRARASRAPE